jgi:hypothetical protein
MKIIFGIGEGFIDTKARFYFQHGGTKALRHEEMLTKRRDFF